MTKDYVISLEVNDSGAVQSVDKLEQSLTKTTQSATSVKAELRQLLKELSNLPQGSKEFDALSKKAGQLQDQINDASEAVRANAGNAFETLSNNVGNLGNRFQNLDFEGITQDFRGIGSSIKNIKFDDLAAGVKAAGSSFLELGKALLANPIFLIGGAIAALVLNFDEIKEVLDLGVNPATRALAEETQKAAEASKEAFDAFGLEERRLRALGVAEDEIAEKRKAATKERLAAIRAQRQAEAKILAEQLAEFEKTGGQGLGLFGPSLDDIKEGTKRLQELRKQEEEFAVQVLEIDKKISDGKQQEIDKQSAANQKLSDQRKQDQAAREREEQERVKRERELANQIFAIQQEVSKKIQTELGKGRQEANTAIISAADERFKIEEQQAQIRIDLLAEGVEKEIALNDAKFAKLREQAQGNAELTKQIAEQNRIEVEAIEKKYDDQRLAEQQKLNQTRLQFASDGLGALSALVGSFNAKNEAQAKKQFQITKALNIAQALVNTYSAVTGALTAGGNPAKLATGAQFVEAGIAATVGLANVAKIASTQYGSGGGGGGGSVPTGGSSGGGTQSGPPQFNPINTQFLQNRPPQAAPTYVISGAVTNAQQADQKINELARL
jgi:hypothetical protein